MKKNKSMVEWINELTILKNIVKNVPKDEVSKFEEYEKIIDIVERILELNNKKKQISGLKILTPDQVLSILPITLAQLKAKKILKNLKMKLDNYYILCTYQKNLQNNCIKIWLTLFKNGNNLTEHWK